MFVNTFLSKVIENINLSLLYLFSHCYNSSKDGSAVIINVYRQLMFFVMPVVTIFYIYLRLFLHVRKINRQSTAVSIVQRARQELRMMLRIIIILILLGLGSIVGFVFGLMNTPPLYRWRIYYLSLVTSAFVCILSIFFLTTSFKEWLLQRYNSTNINVNRVHVAAVHLSTFRQT